jgi:hypothetical protein
VGAQPVDDYCREIEAYLCRKNDGHLVRVVGPSFDLVSAWAVSGIPLKVALTGIDRCFERYYRKGPRRRPVRIDFCEADVLEAFDEWRRALGLTAIAPESPPGAERGDAPRQTEEKSLRAQAHGDRERHGPSLPLHLERALLRLTEARARGSLDDAFDGLIDRVARELDQARASRGGVRGAVRQALRVRLAALDAELLQVARASLDEATQAALMNEADRELTPFRSAMPPDQFARARKAAVDRLLRGHRGLPTLSFE